MTELTPAELGPYTLDRLLASGAQAEVWLAIGEEGEVALKVPRNEAGRAVMLREASFLKACAHPNVVKMHGVEPSGQWLATEYIDGDRFDQWSDKRSIGDIIGKATDLVEALRHLHGKGMIHGDLKPANILVDRHSNTLKLLDLGVASWSDQERRGFTGTLGFAAPELLRGGTPSPRTDVYGLGATLYACLTGRAPFTAPDPAALTYVPLVSLPAPPAAFRPDMPMGLETVLLTLLAREPHRRPAKVDKLGWLLKRGVDSPIGMPVVGMHDTRELLRRAVVGACDQECRVVILYGPVGSGRNTLIGEAMVAARREGLRVIESREAREIATQLRVKDAQPPAVALDSTSGDARTLLTQVLQKRVAGLFLMRASRPMPELGASAIQVSPAPLSTEDSALLAAFYEVDAGAAEAWRADTGGLPAAFLARLQAATSPDGLAPLGALPADTVAILQRVAAAGEVEVEALATLAGLREQLLLDHVDVLVAAGRVVVSADGRSVSAR